MTLAAAMPPIKEPFGPLIDKRSCGECTACCTVAAVAELDKPADTACRHACGAGCAIYEVRPAACRAFHCGWRRLAWLPTMFRPDRSGVIVMVEHAPDSPNPFDRKCLVVRGIDSDPLENPGLLRRIVSLVGRRPLPVFSSAPGANIKSLVHPRADIYWPIVDGLNDASPEVERWRKALGA